MTSSKLFQVFLPPRLGTRVETGTSPRRIVLAKSSYPNNGSVDFVSASTSTHIPLVDCELVLPSPPNANASRTLARRSLRADGWMATLSAELGEARDAVYFGVATTDRLGRGWHFSKPPAVPIGSPLELFLVSSDGRRRLGTDVRASVVHREGWQCVLRAHQPGGQVTVRWPDLGRAPRPLRFYLIDETTGARRYMRTSTAYSFRLDATAEERRFRIEVDASPPERLISQVNVLSSDHRTGTRLALVLSKAATVDARVITPSGKIAAIIARNVPARPGLNSLAWNGKGASGATLPRGVYLVEVLATDDEGRQVKAVRSAVMR